MDQLVIIFHLRLFLPYLHHIVEIGDFHGQNFPLIPLINHSLTPLVLPLFIIVQQWMGATNSHHILILLHVCLLLILKERLSIFWMRSTIMIIDNALRCCLLEIVCAERIRRNAFTSATKLLIYYLLLMVMVLRKCLCWWKVLRIRNQTSNFALIVICKVLIGIASLLLVGLWFGACASKHNDIRVGGIGLLLVDLLHVPFNLISKFFL